MQPARDASDWHAVVELATSALAALEKRSEASVAGDMQRKIKALEFRANALQDLVSSTPVLHCPATATRLCIARLSIWGGMYVSQGNRAAQIDDLETILELAPNQKAALFRRYALPLSSPWLPAVS